MSSPCKRGTLQALLLLSLKSILLVKTSTSWQKNYDGIISEKVKPKITQPSGPANVSLFVVSRSELGVTWMPPLHNGGKTISKYLVEWDTDKYMRSGIASPSNPYENSVDGPLARSEVVLNKTNYRITGLKEGQKYFVRVSAYGHGYSSAISSNPSYAIPRGMPPGPLTHVFLSVASDSETADRLRVAWSAPTVDINGFNSLPPGCATGETSPSDADPIKVYRIIWDTHPSLSNAKVYDVPAVDGDGHHKDCCPFDQDGTCQVELGAEVQMVSITYPGSPVLADDNLFESGGIRVAYIGSQSKSIRVETPALNSTKVWISSSAELPPSSPIEVGDIIRIKKHLYLVSSVIDWPNYIIISTEYQGGSAIEPESSTVQAYFTTPPSTCFDVSGLGNSAENFRSHIAQNFDDSPFDETIAVSRTTMTKPFEDSHSGELRVTGYTYHVTFSGQGFSSTYGNVEELIIISKVSSPFSSVGRCDDHFVSSGIDVSSEVSVQVSTQVESGSIVPGQQYYVQIAGLSNNGAGLFVPSRPVAEIPRSKLGLATNCRVYAVPVSSSSLRVEWDSVFPYHGSIPSAYLIEFHDMGKMSPVSIATHLVNDIDENSHYSVTKTNLTAGTPYKVLIIPINELGKGGPTWYKKFNPVGLIHNDGYSSSQNYHQQSCHAVPTCDSTSIECTEIDDGSYEIIARSVPSPPNCVVATYPHTYNQNRFTANSIHVTFESPLKRSGFGSIGVTTDKFRVQWSTSSTFRAIDLDGSFSLWSAEVEASYKDDDLENASGEYTIESLIMGKKYFARVFAHNSAGYGSPSMGIPIKAMTSPDPPYEPVLSGVTNDNIEIFAAMNLGNKALIGSSILVSWLPPRVDSSHGRPDIVGDGGDLVNSYLVEWSRVGFDKYYPTMVEISVKTSLGTEGANSYDLLSGSFQIRIDTTLSSETAIRGIHESAKIPVDASASVMKTIIENVPNVGEVRVYHTEPFTWIISFLSEVGDVGVSLAENYVVDDEYAPGTVDIIKIGIGSVPEKSAYRFDIIRTSNDLSKDRLLHYAINQLVPGIQVFVRISAGNQVGFGPRRKTAPEFIFSALQRPDYPTSLYSDTMPPYLSLHSPTSLEVHIGPPSYDSGLPLTTFLIEWDSSPLFDSSIFGDGSALGSAQVNASHQVCTACVTKFDSLTNIFTYSGNERIAKLLTPQRKIMIYFSDDDVFYTFSIESATNSRIIVSSQHLRVLSLDDMHDKIGSAASDLALLGSKFVIDGLLTGKKYYVRVSSENGEGTGKSIATVPQNETPRGFPRPPTSVTLEVSSKTSIKVSWSNSTYLNDPTIIGFKVERFCKSDFASSDTFSFFGQQEMVEFSTSGLGLVGGFFSVHFGELEPSTSVFLGYVKATNGLDYVETNIDFTSRLQRGDRIIICGEKFYVHDKNPLTSTRISISEKFLGDTNGQCSIYARSKSMPVSYDASAKEFQNALERMPYVNHVEVRREIDDMSDGFNWFVTFISNAGPQNAFSADTTHLIGTNPMGFSVIRRVLGILPDCYVTNIIESPMTTSFDLQELVTGKPYFVRIASISEVGESAAVESIPDYLIPGGTPKSLLPPSIRSLNESTLLVSFEAPDESNGALIDHFLVDLSRNPGFVASTRFVLKPDYKIHRVTTRAHSVPWSDSSSFTLSLGDFHGDFNVPISGGTTVRIMTGTNIIERSTGSISLSSFVARGDYISVGGIEFRVCLNPMDYTPYNELQLSLCSEINPFQASTFNSSDAVDVIEGLPIFRLDTSLGAARSPTIGDTYLSTADESELSKDALNRLRRGDLIRVGHPDLGETFRVSTDSSREFSDGIIPLGFVEDPKTPASLSAVSLQHSTCEVQSFYFRSNTDLATLTPSSVLNSGYRIRFKSDTTHKSTAAGSNGCLKWDGDEYSLKVELESLAGIDSVKVSKQVLPAIPDVAGAGVKYLITFTGMNVRGNVPPLQILDVGINGCLDATTLGGNFKNILAPITVEQVEVPFVPIYDVQTTADIPYDASSADVKAAIESLSQACSVSVSRKVDRNGYSWDVTFVESKRSTQSPLLVISVNGENLSAYVDPGVSAIGLQQVELPTESKGVPYFVRVAAVNAFGIGPFVSSNPRAREVLPQPPSEPVDFYVEPISTSEILVTWNPPLENGGRSVTHYKVDYDKVSSFMGGINGGPYGSLSLSSSAISRIHDVQSITVKIDNSDLNTLMYLAGTFSLNFDGQRTRQLKYNASSKEMKDAIEELCSVEKVHVSRSIHCSPSPSSGCITPDGFTWLVTFDSIHYEGNQHNRYTSKLSTTFSHRLSVDGSYLFECTDASRKSCSLEGNAKAYVGSIQEIQQVQIASSKFSVTIRGETSDVISLGDTIEVVEEKLNAYSKNGIGKIEVTCADCIGNVIGTGNSIFLQFLTFQGDLPLVVVSDPDVSVSEVVKGTSQFVIGRSFYSTIISGLTSLDDWYVRVFAYNGVGEGRPAIALPSPCRLAVVAPQIPEDISASVQSATSIMISWNLPISLGGVQLTSFIIEYDTNQSFSTQNGMPLYRLTATAVDTDASIATVLQAYPNSIDPILRKRLMINDANLISDGVIHVGSTIMIENHLYIVSSINEQNCGVTCLSIHEEFSGVHSSGMKIYDGKHTKHHRFTMNGLVPGVPYFFRVAAVNVRAMGPFAFLGYPSNPASLAPMDVPTAISWATISPVFKEKLRVDFGPPMLEKPEGVNGSPVSKYNVEVATGINEVQELQISSVDAFKDGSFVLSFKGEKTGCIDVHSSPDDIAHALQNLNTIDNISIATTHKSNKLVKHTITFNGASLRYEDHPMIEVIYSDECSRALNEYEVTIKTVRNGATVFKPEIVALSIRSETAVSGFIELSIAYEGNFNMLIFDDNYPAHFLIVPGSRFAITPDHDLTTKLHPGETILIADEFLTVEKVEIERVEFIEYHMGGTNNKGVFAYRMDNYIGTAVIASGVNFMHDINGRNLQSLVKPGDVIQYITADQTKAYLTVTSVNENFLTFSPSNSGSTVTTPIYVKKKVFVPANSSSAQMKKAIESLPNVGSVEVTRDGPNSSEGYTWYITFISHSGKSMCSEPSWCLSSNIESICLIDVSGLEQDCVGSYISTSFINGRPRYELLDKSCYVFHDIIDSKWVLYSSSNSMLSSVTSSAVTTPLTSWSNNVSVTVSDYRTITILHGKNVKVETAIIQEVVDPSFENIVFSSIIKTEHQEIQEIELISEQNDLGGFFELSLGKNTGRILVNFDESSEDLAVKLQSLSGVGRIDVKHTKHSSKFGSIWSVTFRSKAGDIPLLRHLGLSGLQGSHVILNIFEKSKGSSGPHQVIFSGLEAGQIYAVRIRAENEYGYGPYTTLSQKLGRGVHPFARCASSPPDAPSLSADAVTKSHITLRLKSPNSNGGEISSYKFEWATSNAFESVSYCQVSVSCKDKSRILGFFSFIYGSDIHSRSERTVPIDVRSTADEIMLALTSLKYINEVSVELKVDSDSELKWIISFIHDVTSIGSFSVDDTGLRCQSEEPFVESEVTMLPRNSFPSDYGTMELFEDTNLCGSVALAEFSAVQYMTLSAKSNAVTGGSYQLMLDNQSSECIPFDASELELKNAIERFEHVSSIDVFRTSASAGLFFPYAYKIMFKGSYPFGEWPALKINPTHFGAGSCDVFTGGSGHMMEILPIRDESLCSGGMKKTMAIVADSHTSMGGTFTINYRNRSSQGVRFNTPAIEMMEIITQLTGFRNVTVSKHQHNDMDVGVAWAITFPIESRDDDEISVWDTHVSGKNARVQTHPILKLSSFSPEGDSTGDFRIIVDGESTGPISHQATQRKVMSEFHRINGIGKVIMLGPAEGESLSSIEFKALIDDSFMVQGSKAIAIIGDLTSTITQGDSLAVGSCDNLELENVLYEGFNEFQSAGSFYNSIYATSPETERAKNFGYSVLIIKSSSRELSFVSDCSQPQGVSQKVLIGSILSTGKGVDHSVIVKSHSADIDTIKIVPERNWRGTGPRLFFKAPSGIAPGVFLFNRIQQGKTFIMRVFAKNEEGYGPPSNTIKVTPLSTVPSNPISVSLT